MGANPLRPTGVDSVHQVIREIWASNNDTDDDTKPPCESKERPEGSHYSTSAEARAGVGVLRLTILNGIFTIADAKRTGRNKCTEESHGGNEGPGAKDTSAVHGYPVNLKK